MSPDVEPIERKEVDRHDPQIIEALKNAPVYKKKGKVQIEVAQGGEVVKTILADGSEETVNTAKEGQHIVTNPGGERYIIDADLSSKRYSPTEEPGVYEAKGYCVAIDNPYNQPIEMMASWGEMQRGANDCKLADTYNPDTGERGGEPYIIQREAFENTYSMTDIEQTR
jgi:hypothetical protein